MIIKSSKLSWKEKKNVKEVNVKPILMNKRTWYKKTYLPILNVKAPNTELFPQEAIFRPVKQEGTIKEF